MKELTRLILDDMRPALGVTEPGAIAFAVATAKKYVTGDVKIIRLVLNSGMYKNALLVEYQIVARWAMNMLQPSAMWQLMPTKVWNVLRA